MTDPATLNALTVALRDLIAEQRAHGAALQATLDTLARVAAPDPKNPPTAGLVLTRPITGALPQWPEDAGAPLRLDGYGRPTIRFTGDTVAGPTFVIAAGATSSNELPIQCADEGPVPNALLIPNVGRLWGIYDDPTRAAANVVALEVSTDRVNWRTATATFFGATVGLVSVGATTFAQVARAVRLRVTAGPALTAPLQFPSMICSF